jgi:signal peptidase II
VALGLLAAGVLVLDQVSKTLALAHLETGSYVPLLGEYFGLQLVFNPGAAFSLATGSTWIFTIVAVVVAVVIVRVSRRIGSRGWVLALGGLLGGNLGNLGDRLFRDPGFARGHVVDFLSYNGWFVGNVADIAIVLAAIGMAVLAFLGIGIDGSRQAAETADDDDADEDAAAADADGMSGDTADAAVDRSGATTDDPATDAPAPAAADRPADPAGRPAQD